MLTALGALGFAGYLYFGHLVAMGASVGQEVVRLEDELQTTRKDLVSLRKETDTDLAEMRQLFVKHQTQQNQALKALSEDFSKQLESVTNIERGPPNSLVATEQMLQQVTYLLRTARLSLFFETDAKVLVKYLEDAQQILGGHDEAGLVPVREALTRQLVSLRNQDIVDIQGQYFALDAIRKQLNTLPLQISWIPPTPDDAPEPAQTPSLLSQLISLFRFRVQENPVARTPQTTLLARQHLAITLEQAKIAVLRRQHKIYLNSLFSAHNTLETYFDIQHPDVRALSRQINNLYGTAQKTIAFVPPDINQLLILIEQYRIRIQAALNQDLRSPGGAKRP